MYTVISLVKLPKFHITYPCFVRKDEIGMFVFDSYLSNSQRHLFVRQESTLYNQNTNNSVVILKKGTCLRNAEGTTGDTIEYDGKDHGNMIDTWKKLTRINAPSCVNANCKNPCELKFIDGAHVVKCNQNTNLENDDKVYIIPLCKKCNHHENNDPIILKCDTPAIVLSWGK